MTTAVLVARVALAIVLAVAGVAKLADLPGSREAVRAFGAPAAIAPVAGTLLPLLELLVAVALLLPASARWGALAALALFAAFGVAIGAALRRGARPDCHCFGQLHAAPAGRATLLRNALLAALAAFVVAAGAGDGQASATAWAGRLDATQAIGLCLVATLVLAMIALARLHVALLAQNGRLIARVERLEQGAGGRAPAHAGGLPVGAVAPRFELPAAAGGRSSLDLLEAHGRPVLLVFSDPGCGACRELAPELAAWQRAHADRVTVAVLARGDAHGAAAAGAAVGLLRAGAVAGAYGVTATPSAVLLTVDGRVASRLATGTTGVRALLEQALELAGPAPAPAAIEVVRANGRAPSRAASAGVGDPLQALQLTREERR